MLDPENVRPLVRLLVQETLAELELRIPYLVKMKGGLPASCETGDPRENSNRVTPNPNREMPLLVTARQAAKLLSISERTLWSLTNEGELPAVKIGKSVRYSVKVLETWIADQSKQSSAPEERVERNKKGGRNGNDWQ